RGPDARARAFASRPLILTGRSPRLTRYLTPTNTRGRATCANAALGSRWKIARVGRSSFPGCAAGGSRGAISVLDARLAPLPHVHEMAGDRGGCRHRRRDEVGATLVALAALEIAVRGRGTALAGSELVGVHREAHGAAGLAPLEAGFEEDLVEPFRLGLLLHQAGARHDHRLDARLDALAVDHARDFAQILDARVGAGADENPVKRDVGDLFAAIESHISERVHGSTAFVLVGDIVRTRDATDHRDDLLGARAPRDERWELGCVQPDLTVEMRALVRVQRLPVAHGLVPELAFGRAWSILEVGERLVIGGNEAGSRAGFPRHIADRHAPFHGQRADRFAGIFERVAGRARGADLADDGED